MLAVVNGFNARINFCKAHCSKYVSVKASQRPFISRINNIIQFPYKTTPKEHKPGLAGLQYAVNSFHISSSNSLYLSQHVSYSRFSLILGTKFNNFPWTVYSFVARIP